MKRPLEKVIYKVTLNPKEDGSIGIQEIIVEKFNGNPPKWYDEFLVKENLKREDEVADRFGNFKIVSEEGFATI